MENNDGTENLVNIDDNLDDLLEIFTEMQEDVDKIQPSNVPQQAAKDRMKEILEGAFMPYLAEFIQCNQLFEEIP